MVNSDLRGRSGKRTRSMLFRNKRRWNVVLAITLFLLANGLLHQSIYDPQIDFTADSRHSLSGGSIDVMADWDESIAVDLYFSSALSYRVPQYTVYAHKIQALLAQYQSASGGKIRITVIDPKPFSESEDEANDLGLKPIPLNSGATNAYFGLVVKAGLGSRAVIPQFDPAREALLEYDLTRLFYGIRNPQKPKIGVISSLPMDSDMFSPLASGDGAPAPWLFWMQLRQSFQVEKLSNNVSVIPDDIKLLLIAHPKNLSESAVYAIDQFMLNRGRAVILIDPHSEAMAARQIADSNAAPQSSDLKLLLDHWGIGIDSSKIITDRTLAQRVVIDDGSSGRNLPQGQDYIPWLRLGEDQANPSDTLSASVHRIHFATTGEITLNANAALRMTPLLTTTTHTMAIPIGDVLYNPDPKQLIINFKDSGEKRILAARLQGELSSVYGDVKPKFAVNNNIALPTHIARSLSPLNVVLVADSDMLDDRFWARIPETLRAGYVMPSADNADFIVNAIDQLLGGDAFLRIRTRATSHRPMQVLNDLRQQAEDKYLNQQQQLTQKLNTAKDRLKQLQIQSQNTSVAEISENIQQLRSDIEQSRQALRQIQYDLNRDIERLEGTIRLILILLWPLLVVVIAIAAWRRWVYRTRAC